ncbi:MAG: neutral/alkaline non-lysosomal ceramidase N-terminal domain-containing protein [Candidatus Omnitrophota bacterium]|nr:neutral/alkaline non-lysosomal ceramidase N-terminal domain-containing protein [Candidatus Omnitrophota bacterium]
MTPRVLRLILFSLLCVFFSGCVMRPAGRGPATEFDRIREQIRVHPGSALSAGAAKVEITPPVGTPLAGYAKRRGKPSTGIRDPLYVRTLALSDGEDTLLLISADLLVFPQPLAERILQRISEESGVPRQGIILAATHTHSGAGSIATGFLHEQVFGRYSSKVEEGILSRILWSVRQALENRKPVQWSRAEEGSLLAGFVENRALPGGPVDSSLSVLLFSAEPGEVKAVVVNATAHPTLLDSQDMRFSADYPGELCRKMEEAYPGAVCLFFNGAAGDERPRDAIGATAEERVQRFGVLLAEAATALASRAPLEPKGDLAVWGGWFDLPDPQIRLGPIPLHPEIGKRMRPTAVFLNMAALEGMLLVPLPAELTVDLGTALKRKLAEKGNRSLLLGYANGYLGYAVTPQQYASGSYEAGMTWYGADFGQQLENDLLLLSGLYE